MYVLSVLPSMVPSFERAKVIKELQRAIVYGWGPLLLLFLASRMLHPVAAISSGSSSQIDVDTFLNLPPGESMLAYPASTVADDETEASKLPRIPEPQQQANQAVDSDQIAKRKHDDYIRNLRYRRHLRETPIKLQTMKEKKKESRKRSLAKLSGEALKNYKRNKQGKENIQYKIRKNKRGYGSRQCERLKKITEKIHNNTATPEEKLEYEKVAQQKRESARSRKLREKQIKKSGRGEISISAQHANITATLTGSMAMIFSLAR